MGDPDYLRPRVEAVSIEISSRCNLKCSYCHKSDDVLEALPASNMDMTDAMIGQLYRYCKDNGIRHVTLSGGGETTVVADWHRRLAAFLDDPQIEARINTNFARLLDDDELTAFAKFSNLQISLDSSDVQMVRKLRSKADLRTITFNILRVRQRARELGRSPFIVISGVVCRDNIGHIEKLAGFCRELGVDQLMLTAVATRTEHNPTMPDTLDTLTPGERDLLADQIAAAERILQDGPTSLKVQDSLLNSINGAAEPVEASACRMPWTTLKVMADGRVLPCCDSGRLAVGNVTTSSIADILDGERHRAVRASILAGRPTVRCRGCSWAERGSFEEFARDIRVLQGGPGSQARHDAEVERTIWPGLFSQDGHAVVLENAELQPGEGGAARLIERMRHGLHRVLVEIEPRTATDISLVARPAGRRRLRFDLAHGGEMIARANIILSARPTADVVLGDLDCRVSSRGDGAFEISASLRGVQTISHINIELAREDAAVIYAGDGRSGLIISNLRVAQ